MIRGSRLDSSWHMQLGMLLVTDMGCYGHVIHEAQLDSQHRQQVDWVRLLQGWS